MSINTGFAVKLGERIHPKSAPPMYTEREMVLAQRDAYLAGRSDESSAHQDTRWGMQSRPLRNAAREDAARNIYPLPKITRPRVMRDRKGGCEWAVIDGTLVNRNAWAQQEGATAWPWYDFNNPGGIGERFNPTPERVRMWADLLANPNEEVEDDS